MPCLRLQHAHQVRVRHGCEWVVLHAAFIEQHVAREQVAFKHRAFVVRKCGRGNGEVCAQCVHQRIRYRAYIALRGAVKRGAVFEIDLLRTLRLQPCQRSQRLRNRLLRGSGAGLERHHHRVNISIQWRSRHANGLHHAHTGAD